MAPERSTATPPTPPTSVSVTVRTVTPEGAVLGAVAGPDDWATTVAGAKATSSRLGRIRGGWRSMAGLLAGQHDVPPVGAGRSGQYVIWCVDGFEKGGDGRYESVSCVICDR